MGGQTALNLAVKLAEQGILEKYNVELIGARLPAIKKAEDRELFKQAMKKIGLDRPEALPALKQGLKAIEDIGFPAILRPASHWAGQAGASPTTWKNIRDPGQRVEA